jgi:hypothetical protein
MNKRGHSKGNIAAFLLAFIVLSFIFLQKEYSITGMAFTEIQDKNPALLKGPIDFLKNEYWPFAIKSIDFFKENIFLIYMTLAAFLILVFLYAYKNWSPLHNFVEARKVKTNAKNEKRLKEKQIVEAMKKLDQDKKMTEAQQKLEEKTKAKKLAEIKNQEAQKIIQEAKLAKQKAKQLAKHQKIKEKELIKQKNIEEKRAQLRLKNLEKARTTRQKQIEQKKLEQQKAEEQKKKLEKLRLKNLQKAREKKMQLDEAKKKEKAKLEMQMKIEQEKDEKELSLGDLKIDKPKKTFFISKDEKEQESSEEKKQKNKLLLDNYMHNALDTGKDKEEIKQTLIKSGWPKNFVERYCEHFFEANKEKIEKTKDKRKYQSFEQEIEKISNELERV